METQLKKGLLEYGVLRILEIEDSYGYKIIKDLSSHITISESTLYPILRRLEESSKLTSYDTTYQNRTRRYFKLTAQGKAYLETFRKETNEIVTVLNFIKGE